MQTTIDGAGRLVVPKAMRDALGLTAGRRVEISVTDGRLEVEVSPAALRVDTTGVLPKLLPEEPLPPLTDHVVRDAVESTRP